MRYPKWPENKHGSHYYADLNAVTLIMILTGSVLLTDVRSVVLIGRQWLDRHWAIACEAAERTA